MVMQSNIHFFTNWAKERLDEMDATVTSLEGKAVEVQTDVRDKAKKVLANLREQRDDFRDTMKKQSEANETAWIQAKEKLAADWRLFETEVEKYVESFAKRIEHQQTTFKLQADAQLKAWREAADRLESDAKKFASDRRGDIDAAVKRMIDDAAEAEQKLRKLDASKNLWANQRLIDSLVAIANGARAWSIGRRVSSIWMIGSPNCRPRATIWSA